MNEKELRDWIMAKLLLHNEGELEMLPASEELYGNYGVIGKDKIFYVRTPEGKTFQVKIWEDNNWRLREFHKIDVERRK